MQEEIENRIEVADALAIKLLQRFNHSMSTMKTASQHLSGGNYLTGLTSNKFRILGFSTLCITSNIATHDFIICLIGRKVTSLMLHKAHEIIKS